MDGQVEVIEKETEHFPSQEEVRDRILNFENKLRQLPGAMNGDCFPLKHTFVDGAYVREITMPKGALLTSKIHKICHPYFVMKGDVSVLTERGIERIKAPFSGVTPAGTKRILYIHEDTVWITVHVTKKKNLKRIEKEIIATSFEELEDESEKNKLLTFVTEVSKEDII